MAVTRRGALKTVIGFTVAYDANFNAALCATGKVEVPDWAQASALLRPKLLPSFYADAFPGLVRFPFSAKLIVGLSIDRGDADEYIRESASSYWKMPVNVLLAQALANLDAMSRELPSNAYRHDAGAAFLIAKGDGYDAPRLLLPNLRARFLASLGSKVQAAVPARDLLMVWSTNDPDAHHRTQQVAAEWRVRPFALTDEIFTITKEGIALDGRSVFR